MTGCVGPFVFTLLSSTPSIEKPLKRGRVPPIEPPEPSTPPCCVVVPGANTENSFTSPPSVFKGRSWTAWSLNVAPSSEDSVFTNSAPAVTSTTDVASPTSSVAATSATWLDSTCTPLLTDFLNPDFSTVMVYEPTRRFGKTYVPALDAVAVVETPVASLVTVTLASRIPAPVESETVIRNVPSSLCAFAKPGKISIATTKARRAIQTRPGFSRLAATLLTADRKPPIVKVLSQFILLPSIRRNHLNVSVSISGGAAAVAHFSGKHQRDHFLVCPPRPQ